MWGWIQTVRVAKDTEKSGSRCCQRPIIQYLMLSETTTPHLLQTLMAKEASCIRRSNWCITRHCYQISQVRMSRFDSTLSQMILSFYSRLHIPLLSFPHPTVEVHSWTGRKRKSIQVAVPGSKGEGCSENDCRGTSHFLGCHHRSEVIDATSSYLCPWIIVLS